MAVVEQPVEDGGGDDGVAEDGTPLADRAVAGDQQAAALVASGDELEEEMRGVALKTAGSRARRSRAAWAWRRRRAGPRAGLRRGPWRGW